jgi:hypothetical protein
MSPKARNITGWVLTALIGLLLIFSALIKIKGGDEMAKNIVAMGLTMDNIKIIGVVEIICALLFIIPRTGVLGTLLVAAYLGGAIATHVEHQLPVMMPILVECLVFITAIIRFPELSRRLMGNGTPA